MATRINNIGNEVSQNKAFGALEFDEAFNSGDIEHTAVNSEDMGHVMSLLSSFYNKPQLSAIREYVTNAVDANIMAAAAGHEIHPVEISIPGDVDGTLLIRDYGTGLDRAGLIRAFTRYGASDKRDDTSTTGGFGLGSKSALAFAKSFNIASTYRDENGDYITTFAVMRPNGIEFRGTSVNKFTSTGTFIEIAADGFKWNNDIFNVMDTLLFAGNPDGSIVFKINGADHWTSYPGLQSITIGQSFPIVEIPGAEIFVSSQPLPEASNIHYGPWVMNWFIAGIHYEVNLNEMGETFISDFENSLRGTSIGRQTIRGLVVSIPAGIVDFPAARDSIQLSERTINVVNIITEYVKSLDGLTIAMKASYGSGATFNELHMNETLAKMTYGSSYGFQTSAAFYNERAAAASSIAPIIFTEVKEGIVVKNEKATVVINSGLDHLVGATRTDLSGHALYLYDPQELAERNVKGKHGLTDKIFDNRFEKLEELTEAGVKFNNVPTDAPHTIIAAPNGTVSHAYQAAIGADKIFDLNLLFDEMRAYEAQQRKEEKAKPNIPAVAKATLSILGQDNSNSFYVISTQSASQHNIVGWYHSDDKDFVIDAQHISRLLVSNSSEWVNSSILAQIKASSVSAGNPTLLKIRKGSDPQKYLDAVNLPDLPNYRDLYINAYRQIEASANQYAQWLSKRPDLILFAGSLSLPINSGIFTQESLNLRSIMDEQPMKALLPARPKYFWTLQKMMDDLHEANELGMVLNPGNMRLFTNLVGKTLNAGQPSPEAKAIFNMAGKASLKKIEKYYRGYDLSLDAGNVIANFTNIAVGLDLHSVR